MYEARSKDIVLRKVREALAKSAPFVPPTPDFSKPIYPPQDPDLSIAFAENFLNLPVLLFTAKPKNISTTSFLNSNRKTTFSIYLSGNSILKKTLHAAGINFIDEEKEFIKKAEAGLTTCEALIARTGSILVSSATSSGRRLSYLPGETFGGSPCVAAGARY